MLNDQKPQYDDTWIVRLLRSLHSWLRSHLADVAVYLATALYALAYGTQHLAGHVLVHVWLRSPIVRWITILLAAIGAGFFLVAIVSIWLTWRPLTAADLAPLTGTVAAFERNPDDGRLIIELAEYGSQFLLHASSGPYFQEAAFLRDVRPGDRITIRIDNQLRGYLRQHKTLVAHEIEADGTVYVALQPVQDQRRQDIFETGPWVALGALSVLAAGGLWYWRATRS